MPPPTVPRSPGTPRARRRGAVVALGALLFTSACTGERPTFAEGPDASLPASSTSASPRPGTVLVESWAEAFCSAFGTWQEAAAEAGRILDERVADTSDPATVRDSLVELLDEVASTTDAFADEIRQGEVPDVEDGPDLIEALAQRFDDISTTFGGYRDEATAIDIDDPDRFQADVDAVVEAMADGQEQIAQSFEEIDRDFPDAVVQGALRRSCATN